MQQVFIDDVMVGNEYVTITGDDVHHIRDVLRMKPGEKIRVSTSSGRNMYCELAEFGAEFIQADILDEVAADTELTSQVVIFQGLPKGDRMETIIKKSVELGVHEVVPVRMRYCVKKLEGKKEANKLKRWQSCSESAAKQSKRSSVPQIHKPLSFAEALDYAHDFDLILIPYENKNGMAATADALDLVRPGMQIGVFIGPEGGFAEEELAMLPEKAQVISLGRRILRTDTAAITAMAMLMLRLEAQSADTEQSTKSTVEAS